MIWGEGAAAIAKRAKELRRAGHNAEEAWCIAAGVVYVKKNKGNSRLTHEIAGVTRQVVEALESLERPATANDIAPLVGLKPPNVLDALGRAARAGYVKQNGKLGRAFLWEVVA